MRLGGVQYASQCMTTPEIEDQPVLARPPITWRLVTLIGASSLQEAQAQQEQTIRWLEQAGWLVVEASMGTGSGPLLEIVAFDDVIDEREAAFHAKLGTGIVEAMRQHGVPKAQVTRIGGRLRRNDLSSLLDVHVAGKNRIRHMWYQPTQSMAYIEASMASVLGEEGTWLDEPDATDIARWCSRLDQVNGIVVGNEYSDLSLQEILDMPADERPTRLSGQREDIDFGLGSHLRKADDMAARRAYTYTQVIAEQFRLARHDLRQAAGATVESF